MWLQLKDKKLNLSRPLVMGILNITPDSFSDGGCYQHVADAVKRARVMCEEGAAIIDVGGESTRPGASPVAEAEELDRTIPVIEAIKREIDCLISIDTTKPAVMRSACTAGAVIINDINAFRSAGAIEAAHDTGAAVCLMHMQGSPQSMQSRPEYEDVCAQVSAFLYDRMLACMNGGIGKSRIVVDPGFGFGKRLEHNLTLLAQLNAFKDLGCPLLVGLSRKSMFQQLLGLSVDQRLQASVVAAALAVWQGAAIVRAHDVRATVEAITLASAVREYRSQH